MLEIVIGIAAICFVLLYLSFNLQGQQHAILQILVVMFVMIFLFLLANAVRDNAVCTTQPANTTTTYTYAGSNLTSTTSKVAYKEVCLVTPSTATIFYKAFLWLFRIFWIYAFCYLVYFVFFRTMWMGGKK